MSRCQLQWLVDLVTWSDSDPIKISLGGACAASQVKNGNEVGVLEEEEEKGPIIQLALYLGALMCLHITQ